LGFVLFCAVGFGWLWTRAGGHVPVVAPQHTYRISFETDDVKNLLAAGDVKIAGVKVGSVVSRKLDGDKAKVTLGLDDAVAPLHDGAKVQIGVKSLVGTSYVDVTDGSGPTIPSGSTLPTGDVKPAVDVDELFSVFDQATNRNLSSAVQELGRSTQGTGKPLDQVMTGLGEVGTQGKVVLGALAKQGNDLQQLTVDSRNLLDQLDEGQGQIASLVSDAQTLTKATASRQQALEATVRALPGVLSKVQKGAASLQELSGPLTPVARSLQEAAPDLSQALVQLPAVTSGLHDLLPSLDSVLKEAPDTLKRVPSFDATLRKLVPTARVSLSDIDPMLTYLAPYGLDTGVMFGNFAGSFDDAAEDGIYPLRLSVFAEGPTTVRELPIKVKTPLEWNNPYPKPGELTQPKPFTGDYPHVERASQ
jgi:phospholipid/cholesterol/gamma-HCH transport system substrate-binding protein